MKFLVDAQLPGKICAWLREAGYDAKHTLALPLGNLTPDRIILEIAKNEDRIIVSKDDDFVQSHLITGQPERLLLIATGNIGNAELEKLLRDNLSGLAELFKIANFIEIGRDSMTAHF